MQISATYYAKKILLATFFAITILSMPAEVYAANVTPSISNYQRPSPSASASGSLDSSASAVTLGTGAIVCTAKLVGPLAFSLISPTVALLGQARTEAGANTPSGLPVFDAGTHQAIAGHEMTDNATAIASNLGLGVDISRLFTDEFLGCMTRTIARAMLQQVMISTINWVNSGFNGAPSFVPNYQQFFLQTADVAAGQFIQGSGLAFLCSPFQLQVKIAVAQAYASGREGPRMCSIASTVQTFMNGDFSGSGGWQTFLSFTTEPTNNPYGAFMYAEAQLNGAVANAQQQKTLDLQLGNGFLSATQEKNCKVQSTPPADGPGKKITIVGENGAALSDSDALVGGQTTQYRVCDIVNVTPGTAIADSLNTTIEGNTQSLINAKYFDELISAVVSQLIQKTLYSGLSNLSSGGGYGNNSYGQADYSQLRATITENIAPYEQYAQQLIDVENQNITDIQTRLTKAQALASACTASTSGAVGTSTAQTLVDELQTRHAAYQSILDFANESIDKLESYQGPAQSADITTLETLVTAFTSDTVNGTFITAGDISNAAEDRTILLSYLTDADTKLASTETQCNATP